MNVQGKNVLITGGGSGIGLSIAKAFLDKGCTVIICGRSLERLEKAQEKFKDLKIAQCDVTDRDQIKALRDRCETEFNGVDIVVNNAGIFCSIDVTNDSEENLDEQMKEIDIDFNGPVRIAHYFLPLLSKRSEAAIINVSSGLSFIPLALAPVYSATKAAVHAWTQSLRHQLKGSSVRVFELMPPLVDTELVSDINMKKMSPETLANELIKGMEKNRFEITPGQSSQLKMMRRVAPDFIFNAMNKQMP